MSEPSFCFWSISIVACISRVYNWVVFFFTLNTKCRKLFFCNVVTCNLLWCKLFFCPVVICYLLWYKLFFELGKQYMRHANSTAGEANPISPEFWDWSGVSWYLFHCLFIFSIIILIDCYRTTITFCLIASSFHPSY